MPTSNDLAAQIAARQAAAVKELTRLPAEGARQIPVIQGLTAQCAAEGCLENTLVEATNVLVESGRVFTLGNTAVLECDDGDGKYLATLATGGVIESGAAELLANVFLCGQTTKNGHTREQPPSNRVTGTLFSREPTRRALPRISLYSRRPAFDQDLRFCNPGWNAESRVLIHGPEVAPQLPDAIHFDSVNALDRLPLHLKQLLSGFCFASDADLANAVGMLLTGMLMSHHTDTLHPLALLDGNQPGVGKTLLARTIGMVLDGCDPRLINYTSSDEELGKQILSTLVSGNQSCLIIDNAKVRAGSVVSSPVLEANSVAAEISLRILGKSQNHVRPNDVLWFLTMNDTKVSPDLVSRCVPIRFRHEGDPAQREFPFDPVEYARQHRSQILGELAGMVLYWSQQGRTLAVRPHRLRRWSEQIGGILEANGLPEFLTNLQQAANDFNTELDETGALAEQCLKAGRCWFQISHDADAQQSVVAQGAKPSQWRELLKSAGLMEDELQAAKGARGVAQKISNFLGKQVNRAVTIRHNDQELTATLRVAEARSREKFYCFEIGGELAEGPTDRLPASTPSREAVPAAKPKTCATQRKKLVPPCNLAEALIPEPLDAATLSAPSLASKGRLGPPATTTITAVGRGNVAAGNSEAWA